MARVVGSLGDRSTGVLEVMSMGTGELRPPPGVRPIAREALNARLAGERSIMDLAPSTLSAELNRQTVEFRGQRLKPVEGFRASLAPL